MMIKFRVWDKEENKMHKVKTIEFSRRGARIIHLAEVNSNGKGDHKRWHSSVELMQSTGLKDKNGVEIYEGDIIKTQDGSYGPTKIFVVKRNNSNGGFHPMTDYDVGYHTELNWVIGNIHQNPDLLEGD
ncbi:YopX family protein [Staphylococcus hominis]|uniref:YopX family protein n=1 Tax=Staphylococcus hominis TaxID=1290 RepID=UPI00119D0796